MTNRTASKGGREDKGCCGTKGNSAPAHEPAREEKRGKAGKSGCGCG